MEWQWVIGLVPIVLTIYGLWRKVWIGPDIKLAERPIYRGSSKTNGIPVAWSWRLKIRNDGSRDGEIRNTRVDLFEVEPQSSNPQLEVSTIDGTYPKGKPSQIDISVRCATRNPDAYSVFQNVTKLTVLLKWEKETWKGFTLHQERLYLIPEPKT